MAGSDFEVWQKIAAGDEKAWAELVERYQALVYTVAIRAGLSLDEAADCFQTTWTALYSHRRSVKDPSRLAAWLVTTARREAIRLRRTAASARGAEHNVEEIDSSPLPDEDLIRLERQAQLETAISRLNAKCQRLIEIFFFAAEDKTYDQIAAFLGVEPNSLGPMRRRCLDRLKEILMENGYIEVRDGDEGPLLK